MSQHNDIDGGEEIAGLGSGKKEYRIDEDPAPPIHAGSIQEFKERLNALLRRKKFKNMIDVRLQRRAHNAAERRWGPNKKEKE